jgi:hypothetical protein
MILALSCKATTGLGFKEATLPFLNEPRRFILGGERKKKKGSRLAFLEEIQVAVKH